VNIVRFFEYFLISFKKLKSFSTIERALCNDSICMNGGICIQINDTTMDCQCDLGFFGEFCELGKRKLFSWLIRI
jgi:hypothetical protein